MARPLHMVQFGHPLRRGTAADADADVVTCSDARVRGASKLRVPGLQLHDGDGGLLGYGAASVTLLD